MGNKEIRIWDAGCAMGPEPFSLAILLAENLGNFAFKNVKIDATDIDRSDQFEDVISEGVYPYEQLKRIPDEIFQKYFSKYNSDNHYQIDYKIRKRVNYTKHDLLSLEPIYDRYNLILCKNVLLHLQPEERISVFRMFHESLNSGGFLALEQTQELPKKIKPLFEKVKSHAQIFKKVE